MCRLFSSARRIVYALLPTIWLVDWERIRQPRWHNVFHRVFL